LRFEKAKLPGPERILAGIEFGRMLGSSLCLHEVAMKKQTLNALNLALRVL